MIMQNCFQIPQIAVFDPRSSACPHPVFQWQHLRLYFTAAGLNASADILRIVPPTDNCSSPNLVVTTTNLTATANGTMVNTSVASPGTYKVCYQRSGLFLVELGLLFPAYILPFTSRPPPRFMSARVQRCAEEFHSPVEPLVLAKRGSRMDSGCIWKSIFHSIAAQRPQGLNNRSGNLIGGGWGY